MTRFLRAWRAIPLDLRAFVIITLGIAVTHVPFTHYGLCFNDPAWMYHFGHKTLHGATPYRDYVWQVGPLPVYVDAAFQEVFGEHYRASLYAAIFIHILRVTVVWAIARRLSGLACAALVVVFCSFDPLFSYAHHWSTPYAELFFTTSGLFALLSLQATGRRESMYLAAVGATAALVVASRQSSAVTIAVVLAASTVAMAVRREYFTRRRMLALWGGFVAGLVLFALVLAALGVFGRAMQQMFLDGPQKKGIHGIDAVLDAVSGGALVDGRYTRVTGFLFFLGLPAALTGGLFYLAARPGRITSGELGMLVLPAGIVMTLLTRYGDFELTTDLPRTFLSAAVLVAAVFPERWRAWFGSEPWLAIGLGAIPLASDWALEMSFPGRGWGDVFALVTGGFLLGLASSKISARAKLVVCGALASAALIHVAAQVHADFDPFAKIEASDGTMSESSFSPHVRAARTPVLRGIRVPEWRAKAIEWLGSQVEPGSTCFVYANLPLLYDLLDCTNPTKLDDTITDFPSLADVRRALKVMREHPPDYILAHDRMWMSPAISLDLGGDIDRYDAWNRRASFELHMGLRRLAEQYDSLGTVGEVLGPALTEQAKNHWDAIDAIHVYRLRKSPAQ